MVIWNLIINNLMTNQNVKIAEESQQLSTVAKSLVIDSAETMQSGTELLSQTNKMLDRIKEQKETVLKPLREAQKAENARWKPMEDELKPIVADLRKKLGDYQRIELERKEAEEAKIAARMKPGKGNLKAETAIRKMGDIDGPEEKIKTESGGLSFRKKQVVKLVDIKKIPNEYFTLDETMLLAALKDGVEVPGAELDFEMVPVNKR